MKTIIPKKEMQGLANLYRQEGKRIAFVPTMGFLHEGHLSLIRRARKQGDIVVTSIYVNPTQFGPKEDYDVYPRDLERDRVLASDAGTDILFVPSDQEMYEPNHQTTVRVERLTRRLCGASRPWHFPGVTTIVTKLFNIVKPHIAVFGQKDAQQAIVIRRMVKDLDMDIEIDVGPIVREKDGLAMSSRNKYLSPQERAEATILYSSLQLAKEMIEKGERDANTIKEAMREMIDAVETSRIDYIEIVDTENLEPLEKLEGDVLIAVAVFFGATRLIDNILFKDIK